MSTELRFGVPDDADGICEVDSACFSEPSAAANTRELLCNEAISFAVLSEDGRIVSYCSAMFVLDEVQIINVATHPRFSSRGYGSAVLGMMLSYAADRGAVSASLEVRRSNDRAINLYKRHGFTVVGVRRGFYSKPTEDALIMTAKL